MIRAASSRIVDRLSRSTRNGQAARPALGNGHGGGDARGAGGSGIEWVMVSP
jgi:hypothetical protein